MIKYLLTKYIARFIKVVVSKHISPNLVAVYGIHEDSLRRNQAIAHSNIPLIMVIVVVVVVAVVVVVVGRRSSVVGRRSSVVVGRRWSSVVVVVGRRRRRHHHHHHEVPSSLRRLAVMILHGSRS